MNLTMCRAALRRRASLCGVRGFRVRGARRLRRGEASGLRGLGDARGDRGHGRARRRPGRYSGSSKDEGDAVAAGDTLARDRRREAHAPAPAAPRERRRDTGEPQARRRNGAAGGGQSREHREKLPAHLGALRAGHGHAAAVRRRLARNTGSPRASSNRRRRRARRSTRARKRCAPRSRSSTGRSGTAP